MRCTPRTCEGKSRGNSRLNRSKSLVSEPREPELLIRRRSAENQSSDQLPHGGTVLEAVPRSTTHQPRVCRLRVPIDDEMLVGGFLVLADARLEQRRALESGESVRDIIAGNLQRRRSGRALTVRRIEQRAARVVGDLEAAPLVAGDAVHEARAMIRPDGQRLLGEAPVAGGRSEKEDLLARGAHTVADHVWEERAQPRAAGKDEAIGRQPTAVRQCHRSKLAAARFNRRLDGELTVFAALREKSLEHGGTRPPRGEIAAVLLQNRPADLFAIDLREAARNLGALQLLERDARVAQDRQRGLLVLVVALDEPEDADAVVQLPVPPRLVFFPERERPRRHPRVDRAWSVGRANDARLPARARARIAGTPGVDERDAGPPPLAPQKQRRPAAERTRSDHDDVRLFAHPNPASERDRGSRARFEKCPPL